MMTKNFGLMLIGMMLISTTTFGKTNTAVQGPRHDRPRREVVDRGRRPGPRPDHRGPHRGGPRHMGPHHMGPHHMDRRMVDHIMSRRHRFDAYGICHFCHMNRHEIARAEREIRARRRY